MNTIPKDRVPCKHFVSWEENQAPLGSGAVWNEHFEDCVNPEILGALDETPLSKFCNVNCPGYDADEVKICEVHGEYLTRDGCEECIHGVEKDMFQEGCRNFFEKGI